MEASQLLNSALLVGEIGLAATVALACDVLRVHHRQLRRAYFELQTESQIELLRAKRTHNLSGHTLEDARAMARQLLRSACRPEAAQEPHPAELEVRRRPVRKNWDKLLEGRSGATVIPFESGQNSAMASSTRNRE